MFLEILAELCGVLMALGAWQAGACLDVSRFWRVRERGTGSRELYKLYTILYCADGD